MPPCLQVVVTAPLRITVMTKKMTIVLYPPWMWHSPLQGRIQIPLQDTPPGLRPLDSPGGYHQLHHTGWTRGRSQAGARDGSRERISDLRHYSVAILDLCPVILAPINENVLIGSQRFWQSGLLGDEGVVCEPHALGHLQLSGGTPGHWRQSWQDLVCCWLIIYFPPLTRFSLKVKPRRGLHHDAMTITRLYDT